ncbi:MAG: hypothetical protein BIFFINMI_01650 [Phycisphaerae bacterium]|nr:hypothetical protein [Phycisphaerae bacterium]
MGRFLLALSALLTLLVTSSLLAAPAYQMRLDGSGVPLVFWDSRGFSGGFDDANKIGVIAKDDNPGEHVVVVMDKDGSASGFDQYVFDPALASPNNAVTNGALTVFQTYANQELYAGSVVGGVKAANGLVVAGHARGNSINTFFGLSGNGGTFGLAEYQLRDTSDNFNVDGGVAALLAAQNVGIDTGNFKKALALVSDDGSTFHMLLASSGGASVTLIRKMDIGGYSVAPTATTAGTRSVTAGGTLRDSGDTTNNFMADLVPVINDSIQDIAINPGDGNLYFLSDDRTNGRVFLSAVSFSFGNLGDNSITSIVDLDPDSANTYLELTYTAASNANDLTGENLVAARGLAFSPDGSVLYVTNGDSDNNSKRVFIFDAPVAVPEPATLGLLATGGILLLVAGRRRVCRRRSR